MGIPLPNANEYAKTSNQPQQQMIIVKPQVQQQQIQSPKQPVKKNIAFIWNGENLSPINAPAHWTFKRYFKSLPKIKKGEFETTEEYNSRLFPVVSRELNSYLGSQNFKMTYNADKQFFDIWINKTLSCRIEVPSNLAPDFKNEVKNFTISFSQNYEIVEITAEFRGKFYKSSKFDEDWFNEYEEKKEQKELSDPKKIITFEESQNVWIDTDHNLIWEVKTDQNRNLKYNLVEANNYINDLNIKKFNGFNDWRLPTLNELLTLFVKQYGLCNDHIDNWSKTFESNKLANCDNKKTFIKQPLSLEVVDGWYWSSTKNNNSDYFLVNFSKGCHATGEGSLKRFVRGVRSFTVK